MYTCIVRIMCGILYIASQSTYATVSIIDRVNSMTVQTEYGNYEVTEPVLITLIKSSAVQRLNHIRQYGVCYYTVHEQQFTRFEHSIGVFVLLRHFGASLEEQIAGLLHDVSHTVFSHVGDILFDHYFSRYSYQDDIHEWFLKKMGVIDLLNSYGLGNCCSIASKKRQRMLEQDRPDICIDRIEYLLRGAFEEGLITIEQAKNIIDNLYFENQQWIFKDQQSAHALASIALWLSEHIFGSAWNAFIYKKCSDALKRALDISLLTLDDIHFSTDDVVWDILQRSSDEQIKESLHAIVHYSQCYTVGDTTTYDMHIKGKFLGIDPWVKTQDGVERLSVLDKNYAADFKRLQEHITHGWFLKLHA